MKLKEQQMKKKEENQICVIHFVVGAMFLAEFLIVATLMIIPTQNSQQKQDQKESSRIIGY